MPGFGWSRSLWHLLGLIALTRYVRNPKWYLYIMYWYLLLAHTPATTCTMYICLQMASFGFCWPGSLLSSQSRKLTSLPTPPTTVSWEETNWFLVEMFTFSTDRETLGQVCRNVQMAVIWRQCEQMTGWICSRPSFVYLWMKYIRPRPPHDKAGLQNVGI